MFKPIRSAFRSNNAHRLSKTSKNYSLLLLTLLAPTISWAETVELEEPIIVNASRMNLPIEQVAGGVTVISAEDIEQSHAQSLPELLTNTPGINLVQAGGPGSQTSLFIRGNESNHTAILINGQHQKASLGSASLQNIDLQQVERIEIIRGPQSSIHGSDTIGGLVNIITRKAGAGHELGFEGGSHNAKAAFASTAGESFFIGLSTRKTDGFDSLAHDSSDDKDAFELNSVTLSYLHNWNEKISSEFNASAQEGSADYDLAFIPNPDPYSEFRNHNLQISNQLNLNKNWNLNINIGQSRNETKLFNDPYAIPVKGNYSTFSHDLLNLVAEGKISDELSVSLGSDLFKDTWEQAGNFEESIKNDAVFTLIKINTDANLLTLSGRQDDNEQFGTHNTYRASYQYQGFKLAQPYVSIGTGFKAPDFDELFSPWYLPNPDLEPETSRNLEAGLRAENRQGTQQISLFRNEIEEFINAELVDPATFSYRLVNIEEVEIEGLEFSHEKSFKHLSAGLDFTYIKAINMTLDSELLRRPRRLANLNIDYQFGKVGKGDFSAGLNVHAESSRKDLDFSTGIPVSLPGFALLNTRFNYQIGTENRVYLKANNILDKEYALTDGYNTDGANFQLGYQRLF